MRECRCRSPLKMRTCKKIIIQWVWSLMWYLWFKYNAWSKILTSFHHVFHLHCPTPLKKIYMELNASDSELSMQFSYVACQFLVNNLHFIMYFTHRGKSPDRQQPIKEPSLKYYPFLLVVVSSLIWDCNVSLVFIGDTTEFQFVFLFIFLKQGIEGVVWWDQTTAARETTVSLAQMHFTLA